MHTTVFFLAMRPLWVLCLFGMLMACADGDAQTSDDTTTEWDATTDSSSDNDEVSQWQRRLSGTRLHYFHTYRSYNGGFTRIQKLDLCPDGSYSFYAEASFDMMGPTSEVGTWALQKQNSSVLLVLTAQGSEPSYSQLGLDEKQNILLGNKSYIPGREGKYAPACN